MYFVYILKLSNGKFYTGSTPDLKKRMKQHEDGDVIYQQRIICQHTLFGIVFSLNDCLQEDLKHI